MGLSLWTNRKFQVNMSWAFVVVYVVGAEADRGEREYPNFFNGDLMVALLQLGYIYIYIHIRMLLS